MFDKILVANRGEIACRVMRTCRALGIRTVAVYSSADRRALHVELADEAVRIGAAPPSASYLDEDAVVDAARRAGAQAVHPGFGFLSENADFAAACARAGVVFVGPSPEAIRAMGSKAAAKRIMAAAGVPVLSGDPDAAQDDRSLAAAAAAVGYPVMVKPASGGGGRGMRIVETGTDLPGALAAARREAASSFGDDALLVEKYLQHARHVEMQIFGDRYGNVIHLGERDCSVQRRHQKVVEEAPAPGLGAGLRRRLGETAAAAARAVDYAGAGTVEFLVDAGGGHWFLEMNTRIQVEHPVTEMITGIDIVEWQLRVAAGERLPLRQEQVKCSGHAIEARLYAEDPGDGFRPGTGRISHLSLPEGDPGVRIDTGVREGDEITAHYDPMIAKIVAHGPDRETAAGRLSSALSSVRVAGPVTNELFLKAILDHPEFRSGAPDTGFVARHLDALCMSADVVDDDIFVLAALAELRRPAGGGEHSPWADTRGWRLGGAFRRRIALMSGDTRREYAMRGDGGFERGGDVLSVTGRWRSDTEFSAAISGRRLDAVVIRSGAEITVFAKGRRHALLVDDPLLARRGGIADGGTLFARLPGVVAAVFVRPGQEVAAGAPLLVVEAMKVEHTIRAPADGTVTAVHFEAGASVIEGAELIGFDST